MKEELNREYRNWILSRRVLHGASDELQFSTKTIKTALENALMHSMLNSESEEADLWLNVDKTNLKEGFRCVNADESEYDLNAISELISNEESTLNPEKNKVIEFEGDKIKYGKFSLQLVKPVQKALNVLRKQLLEHDAREAFMRSALRYASIYAETRHIGPPQVVYDNFYEWGVRNEGFASPFNARLIGKEGAKFYSLFKDTDEVFGSGGSFFELEKPENPGHWCLDPPFIEETMQKVDSIISDWREKYPEKSILLVIPEWHKPANKPDETATLKANEHFYEGLDGELHHLPVNVCVHRYGEMPGFSVEKIEKGYTTGVEEQMA